MNPKIISTLIRRRKNDNLEKKMIVFASLVAVYKVPDYKHQRAEKNTFACATTSVYKQLNNKMFTN